MSKRETPPMGAWPPGEGRAAPRSPKSRSNKFPAPPVCLGAWAGAPPTW